MGNNLPDKPPGKPREKPRNGAIMNWFASLAGTAGRPAVHVKALGKRDRRRMLRHFLALDDADRMLRFGTVLPDEQIHAYVEKIDFSRDIVFGVVSRVFQLVGVGHLAFAPVEAGSATGKKRVAEFGVSVSKSARGQGTFVISPKAQWKTEALASPA